MLDLNPDKLTDATAEFIDHLKHELVMIMINTVKEISKLLERQVSYDFSKAFIPLRRFSFPAWNLGVWIIFMIDLHSNVKWPGFINLAAYALTSKR